MNVTPKTGTPPPDPERMADPQAAFQAWLDAEIRSKYANRVFLHPGTYWQTIFNSLLDAISEVEEYNAKRTRFQPPKPYPELTLADLEAELARVVTQEAERQKPRAAWDEGEQKLVEGMVEHESRLLEDNLVLWARKVPQEDPCRPLVDRLLQDTAAKRPDLLPPPVPDESKQKLRELTRQVDVAVGELRELVQKAHEILGRVREAAREEAKLLQGYAESPSWGWLPEELANSVAAAIGRPDGKLSVTFRRW